MLMTCRPHETCDAQHLRCWTDLLLQLHGSREQLVSTVPVCHEPERASAHQSLRGPPHIVRQSVFDEVLVLVLVSAHVYDVVLGVRAEPGPEVKHHGPLTPSSPRDAKAPALQIHQLAPSLARVTVSSGQTRGPSPRKRWGAGGAWGRAAGARGGSARA